MKKLITEKDLETGASSGAFAVGPDMILTPSARDYASRHNISLAYPDSKRDSANESAMDRAIRDAVVAEFGRADKALMAAVRGGLTDSVNPSAGAPMPQREVIAEVRREVDSNRVVLTAVGQNRTGILSRLTDVISDMGCDIQNVSQTIVSGYFTMILIVEVESLTQQNKTFEEFRRALLKETEALGLQAMVMHEDVLKAMHRV